MHRAALGVSTYFIMSLSSVFLKIAGEGCEVCLSALCWFVSRVSELCAGAMLRLAGCSSGTGASARGAGRRGDAILLQCFASEITPVIRFYWKVLRSVHACCLPRAPNSRRLATGFVSVLRGLRSPVSAVLKGRAVVGRIGFTSGLYVSLQ